MALRGVARKGIQLALNQIKDMGKDVTFTDNSAPSYDYQTSSFSQTSGTSITIRGLQDRRFLRDSLVICQILLATEDVEGLDQYDLIEFDNYSWSLSDIERDDYISIATLTRAQ